MCKMGFIEHVDVRECWPTEAKHFTKWLSEHLEVLGDEIGLQLTDAETEAPAGDFSADIVVEDQDGRTVVIENQLERTDHEHLGKLLTYLSMRKADVGIWIAGDVRQEHRKAVTWLNDNTDTDFYLVQIEAIKIGDSLPAALLRCIVGSTDEIRRAREQNREMSEAKRIQYKFWCALLDQAPDGHPHSNVSPAARSVLPATAGKNGLSLQYKIKQSGWDVGLYIGYGKALTEGQVNHVFESLSNNKKTIEENFGEELVWEKNEEMKHSWIGVRSDEGGYRDDESGWARIQGPMVEKMKKLHKSLSENIQNLDIPDDFDEEADSASAEIDELSQASYPSEDTLPADISAVRQTEEQ